MSTYAGSKTPTSTPVPTPRGKVSCGVECGVRLLVSQENGDQRFVPLYDSQRNEDGLRHPDELSIQAIMQMVHGSLPLRLDRAFTKVHWTHTNSVSQVMVTKLFKCAFPRKFVDPRGTSIKYRGSTSSLSSSWGSTSDGCFQCKTTFAVAVVITLYTDAGIGVSLKRPGTANSSLPGTPKCESFLSRTQLARSLAGLQSLGDTHSAFDDATMYTRDNTEQLFTDTDGYSPDMGNFNSDGRPARREGIVEVMQSHFSFINNLVEEAMSRTKESLQQYVHSTTSPVFQDSHSKLRAYELSSCNILGDSVSVVRTTLESFLYPVYLLQEKCRSSLSSSSSILPYMTYFNKPVDFQLLCTVVTAALQYHQGWLITDPKDTGRLSLCRFLVHGAEKALVKALLVVLSFFVKCGEVTHSCTPLPTTVFPPSLDFTYSSSQEQLSTEKLFEVSPITSPQLTPKRRISTPEVAYRGDAVHVAAGVAIAAVVCGSRVWHVQGTFSSISTVSPIPSSTYCYGAISKVVRCPFLILGVEQGEVSEEEMKQFVETGVPKWMPCHADDGCIVIDVTQKTCKLHREGGTLEVSRSTSVTQYIRACLECYTAGVPAPDCEESLHLGLSEIASLGVSVIASLEQLPHNTPVEVLRNNLLGVPKSDLPLVIATATALDARMSVSVRGGIMVCGLDKQTSAQEG